MKIDLYSLKIPMLRHFGHAETERSHTQSVIIMLRKDGLCGIGECAPRPYVTGENIATVLADFAAVDLGSVLKQLDLSNLEEALQSVQRLESSFAQAGPNTVCCIEMALLDLIGKAFNTSLTDIIKRLLPRKLVNGTNGPLLTSQVLDFSLDPEEFLTTRGPFHFVKIKVGKTCRANQQRIGTIRAALGDRIPLAVDANMAWDMEQALAMVRALERYAIFWYEEPLKKDDLTAYARLRHDSGAKVILDESVCNMGQLRAAIAHDACDAVNIRIAKCGGILRAIEMAKVAYEHGLDFQLGAQVAEVGPLIAAGRHLASAVSGYTTFEAGQPDRWFADYLIEPMPLVNRKTNLTAHGSGPGLGVIGRLNLLERYAEKVISW